MKALLLLILFGTQVFGAALSTPTVEDFLARVPQKQKKTISAVISGVMHKSPGAAGEIGKCLARYDGEIEADLVVAFVEGVVAEYDSIHGASAPAAAQPDPDAARKQELIQQLEPEIQRLALEKQEPARKALRELSPDQLYDRVRTMVMRERAQPSAGSSVVVSALPPAAHHASPPTSPSAHAAVAPAALKAQRLAEFMAIVTDQKNLGQTFASLEEYISSDLEKIKKFPFDMVDEQTWKNILAALPLSMATGASGPSKVGKAVGLIEEHLGKIVPVDAVMAAKKT